MTHEDWESVRDELEVIQNTAEYGIDYVGDEAELREILKDIKLSYNNIVHTINK